MWYEKEIIYNCVFFVPNNIIVDIDGVRLYGINASIGLPEDNDVYGIYNSPYADKTTLAKDDYVLEVGKTYYISVGYSAGGGSQYPVITNPESVVFKYDTDALEIQCGNAKRRRNKALCFDL